MVERQPLEISMNSLIRNSCTSVSFSTFQIVPQSITIADQVNDFAEVPVHEIWTNIIMSATCQKGQITVAEKSLVI